MLTNTPLIVGVDVHRKTNTYCLMTQEGREVVPRFAWAITARGHKLW